MGSSFMAMATWASWKWAEDEIRKKKRGDHHLFHHALAFTLSLLSWLGEGRSTAVQGIAASGLPALTVAVAVPCSPNKENYLSFSS